LLICGRKGTYYFANFQIFEHRMQRKNE